MRCRYFLYSFITKWNSTKLDSIFISTTSNISTAAFSNAALFGTSNDSCNFDESSKLSTNELPINCAKILRQGSSTNLLGCGSNVLVTVNSCSSIDSSVSSLNNLNSTNLSTLDFNDFTNTGILFSVNPSKNTSFSEISRNESNLSNLGSIAKAFTQEVIPRSPVPIELPTLINPLPKNLHFELPISLLFYKKIFVINDLVSDNSTILIRDLIEGKTVNADIGSVIAYALASNEYEERKALRGETHYCF